MNKDRCWNCKQRDKSDRSQFCLFCIEHNYCSWKYDETKPLITFEEAISYLKSCYLEIANTKINRAIAAERIKLIVQELEKMKVYE